VSEIQESNRKCRYTGVRRITTGLVVGYLFGVLALATITAPPAGAESLPWGIVDAAWSSNQNVINQFTADAIAAIEASNKAQLDSARARAHTSLEDIWYDAIARLDAYGELNPDQAGEVAKAKGQLLADHDGAHAEIDALYQDALGSMTSPTTSTTTSTSTTTTMPTTTSTSTPDTSSTTTVPRSTTTTVPRSTTSTTQSPSTTTTTTTTFATTTTTKADSVVIPTVGGDEPPGTSGRGEISTTLGEADSATSTPAVFAGIREGDQAHFDDMLASKRKEMGMVSAMVSSGASVVLPPGLARIAVAPVLLIEFLIGTLFASVRELIVPVVMLVMAVSVFVWRETRRTSVRV